MHEQAQREWHETLADGSAVLIRSIRPDDAERERAFIESLSLESRYFRFLDALKSPSPELLKKLTDIDWQRAAALVALIGSGAAQRQIGVARFSLDDDNESCECAIAVADDFQHKGLGTLLMRHLIELARARGIKQLYSLDAADNGSMRDFAKQLGFTHKIASDDATLVVHSLNLN